MRRIVSGAFVLWAVGAFLHEALEQLAAAIVIGCALVSWRRKVSLADDVKDVVRATAWLLGWSALSPAIAWARGVTEGWPPSMRYGQLEDLSATAAVAVAATVGVPWRALGWTLGLGWTASFALGLWQHLKWFPYDVSKWTGVPEWRVHQSLDGRRWAAGGFFFHRLRFAHAALAMLGPVVAASSMRGTTSRRVAAGLLAALLVASTYIAAARSATVVAVCVAVLGLGWLASGTTRVLGLLFVAGAAALALASGSFGGLVGRALTSFDDDRGAAMALAFRMAKEHWLLGVGFGNHAQVAATLVEPGTSWVVSHSAHHVWLQAWSETGLVGVGLLAWWNVALVRALWARRASFVASGALLSWVAFQIAGQVHTLGTHSNVMLAFAFVWGLGLAPESTWTIVQTAPETPENQPIQPPPTTSSPS